ncbi:type II toxin-antitoxin system PemK/MazF family toxin [Candidatus Magnetobacterium casense]|uniref:mRNA interferase n=1 Tax=Candidatus Magnetobacterium casense TaxID=1455061 RepID=A0ABS6RZI2_9BACT|nr:type II toxin-antitoxin system PemK/MazF family toxin [Candidatus Magnetobacterium casensis]MBV6342065.1 type II toxin-antitoxin system PemK/MazF family toxin [Candidatus Magnetobacterium casensis]
MQYDVYLINLDPTVGHEIQKTRPCIVISPDEMNDHLSTVIVVPMTTQSHRYPTRIKVIFQDKVCWIVLDQIRTVDKRRLVKKIGIIEDDTIQRVKRVIKEMLVD